MMELEGASKAIKSNPLFIADVTVFLLNASSIGVPSKVIIRIWSYRPGSCRSGANLSQEWPGVCRIRPWPVWQVLGHS